MASFARILLLVLSAAKVQGAAVVRKTASASISPHGDVAGVEDLDKTPRGSRAKTMLSEVMEMASAGNKKIDGDKIQIIKDIVSNELVPDLLTTRQNSVDLIANSLKAIQKCNADAVASQKDISETTEVQVGQVRSTHATCRVVERNKTEDQKTKCDALDAFLNAIEVPATLPPSRKRAQMVEFVTTMSDYFCPKGPEATKLNTACLNAISDLGTHKAECDRNQAAFESGFCTWRQQILDTRSALDTCYSNAAASHGELVDTTKGNVAKWKTEYTSLKKIVCYTDVWLSNGDSSTVDSDKFEKCKSQTVDTSPMDIEYPTVPPQVEIPTTKVDIFPGHSAFPTTEYKDFLDFVVDVIACANGEQ